jgi:hypothetical protein
MSTAQELVVNGKGYIDWADVRSQVLEPKLGKTISQLRSEAEIVSAFEALPQNYYGAFAPDLLYQLWRQGQMTEGALRQGAFRQVLLDVWRFADFPCQKGICPPRAWRAMLNITGFLSDGIEKPKRPRLLYRACTPRGRRGMSWTTERFIAERFITYWYERQQIDRMGNLYKTVAPPAAILGAVRGKMENIKGLGELPVHPEFEFIVDARAISVMLVETGPQYTARLEREEARIGAKWLRLEEQERRRVVAGS